MPVIACLHTADSNVAVFDAALAQLDLGASVTLRHAVRADLLLDSEAAGGRRRKSPPGPGRLCWLSRMARMW